MPESRRGVAPPRMAGFSQKNATRCGYLVVCASSWWKGITLSGGDSFAVNTRSPTTFLRTALPPDAS